MPDRRTLAVAVHDIEPATFDRCALIREWLADHGVERVTLLVIPARDLHPVSDHSPEMSRWLLACERHGDAIVQRGSQHVQPGQRRVVGRRQADRRTLRVDVHPSDLGATRRMLGLEALLRRSAGRRSITYDELADTA